MWYFARITEDSAGNRTAARTRRQMMKGAESAMKTRRKNMLRSGAMILMIILLTAQTALADTYHYTWYRSHIGDSTDQSAIDTITANAQKGNYSFIFTAPEDWRIHSYIFHFIQFDYPELFYLYSGKVSAAYAMDEYGNYTGQIEYDFQLTLPWKGAYQQRNAFEKAVSKAVKKVQKMYKGKSKVKRMKAILKYIAKNCSYKETAYDQTAYGVFVKKKAVCAGYSKAFKVLCDRFKIPCIIVPAKSNSVDHAFNYVKLGKNWYYVDPTWCDRGSKVNYTYFLLGKKHSGCSQLTSAYGVEIPKLAKKDY